MTPLLYDISLKLTYAYEVPVSGGRQLVRVLPLSIPGRQRLIAGTVTATPDATERSDSVDFFGNATTYFLFRNHHEELVMRMQARVQVDAVELDADLSPELPGLAEALIGCWSVDRNSPHHFLSPSPLLPTDADIAKYARETVAPGMTAYEIAWALCTRIYKDFKYDADATEVDTTPSAAFHLKRGVCQDFTHIMITALRALAIPAGYVSGFLRTIPPPGKPRLEGADAMHAWVRVWCGPALGWVELDPTNNIPAGTDHIVVGYGRDYADVAPVIGRVRGYGSHTTDQAVDVLLVA